MSFNREERIIINSKEQSVSSGDVKGTLSHSPSARNMSDGEQVFAKESNKPLALYKKFKGTLWKSYFSNNGNQQVDKDLHVKGRIYQANYPAFSVYQSTSSDEQTLATGTYTTVQYDTISYDVGNDWDTSDYKFTAPITGIYHFSAKLLWDGNADATAGDWDAEDLAYLTFFKNLSGATTTGTSYRESASAYRVQGDLTDVFFYTEHSTDLKLNGGDYIKVCAYHNSGHNQYSYSPNDDDWTVFTGHLITPL